MQDKITYSRRIAVALSSIAGGLLLAACGQHTLSAAQSAPALTTHHITPADLPPPYATPSANNGPGVVSRPAGAKLLVPPGFHISAWAEHLENPRVLTVAPNGDVFVAESGPNRVIVLRDSGAGAAPARSVFADNLKQPFGIAFYPTGANPQYVYVANTDSVVRFPYHNGDLKPTGPAQTIVPDLPGGGYHQHWTRDVVFSPDSKKMYVSVGSQGNVDTGEEEKRAAVLEYNPDGTGYRVFASGIRNAVGLRFNPLNNTLWAAVNERDGLGDDLVPDYVTSIKEGGFYGWPNYYIGANHDPRMPEDPALKARVVVPDVLLTAHSAALSVNFDTGHQFPKQYRDMAFVGMHGSWNRAVRTGYKVVSIPLDKNGRAMSRYQDFVTGWVAPGGEVWGRPVDVAFARDGSMLITDDGGNKIWRVTYGK